MRSYILKSRLSSSIDTQATSRRIRLVFRTNGLTIRTVSEKLNISYQAVAAWCKGNAIPDIDNLIFLKDLTGEPIDDFIVTYDQNGFPCFNRFRVASYCNTSLNMLSKQK